MSSSSSGGGRPPVRPRSHSSPAAINPVPAGPPVPQPPPLNVPPVYLHMTDERNLEPIGQSGLRAGASQGIGDPYTRQANPHSIFVVNPGQHIPDARPGDVGVISTVAPPRDINYGYGRGGTPIAGEFQRTNIPPLRQAVNPGGGPPTDTTYSFTTPMTPRTAAGARNLLSQGNPGRPMTLREASVAVANAMGRGFPMHRPTQAYSGRSRSGSAPAVLSTAPPPSRSRANSASSLDDGMMFEMDDF